MGHLGLGLAQTWHHTANKTHILTSHSCHTHVILVCLLYHSEITRGQANAQTEEAPVAELTEQEQGRNSRERRETEN